MKILFPIGSFYPSQIGGPSNSIYWLCKALKMQKINNYIITTGMGINRDKIVLNKYHETNFGSIIYCRTLFHYFPASLVINSIIKLKKMDIIHLTALFYPGSWIIALFSILYGKKVIWSVRGELEKEALKFSKNKKFLILIIVKLFAKSKNIFFHGTNRFELENINISISPLNFPILLPNYIEQSEFMVREDKLRYFLFIGRIHPIKAIENLINALYISEIFNKSNFILLICGKKESKDYADFLESLISELNLSHKIVFKGDVNGREKDKIFANATATILPSHSENFGNVVIESLSQGTPVIASLNTPWEVLNERNGGDWISNDPTSLKEKIEKYLVMDKVEYESMRINAKMIVDEYFDVHKNVHKWVKVYNRILNEK